MKLNFWQILGGLLLVLGLVGILYREFVAEPVAKPAPPAVTQPLTPPATTTPSAP